ncbi:MAG: hypothetical protein ACK58O_10950, partial [Brevundimonas sp.]
AEPRIIVFARADREGLAQSTAAERATVAELWLSRDWDLYARWTATPVRYWTAVGVPAADGTLARSAVGLAGRQFVDQLGTLLQDNGVPSGYPIVLWRDREGFLKACACADSRSWVFIRDDLGAPDRVRAAAAAPVEPGSADAGPAYPQLEQPLPELTAETSPPPEGTATPPAPPQARQNEETTFF